MFHIDIPIHLPGQAPRHLRFESAEPSWAELKSTSLPAAMFTPATAVPDELLGTWDGQALVLAETPVGDLPKDVVLLIVESPHVSEYGLGMTPIGPLQGASTRTRLRKYLPLYLEAMGVPAGAAIVACNPVQWQASLAALRPPRTSPGEIRTIVWKALFAAGWEADFKARLARYRPGWIINACTAVVKADVDAALPPGVPTWAAPHPSSLHFKKGAAKRVR